MINGNRKIELKKTTLDYDRSDRRQIEEGSAIQSKAQLNASELKEGSYN